MVVLSSNDGCAISRSREAKVLGIPMGAPAFKWRQFFKQHGVIQFSANFELYGDISQRITRLLTGITPRTEVYSVDESFLELSSLNVRDYQEWGQKVRHRLWREVGVPVSIGIAPTKTLAKLANYRAKHHAEFAGVVDIAAAEKDALALHLSDTPIEEIWGIGWRLAPKLKAEGVYSALDLAQLRPGRAARLMGVHGRQLVAELNGQSCHPMEAFGRVRQTVMKGRMFGHDTNQFLVVEAAIASLAARAAFCLRQEGLGAHRASLSLSTNRHKPGYQRQNYTVSFAAPTADTGYITSSLVQAAAGAFNPHLAYHRANVLLFDLTGEQRLQPDLFGRISPAEHHRTQQRMAAFDTINGRYGRATLRYAAEDLSDAWQPRRQACSPRYTTDWQELPVARTVNPAGTIEQQFVQCK